MRRLIIAVVKKDSNSEFVNFSIKDLVKKIFRWAHKKLSQLEDWVLRKIDSLGKKAEEYLKKRIDEITEEFIE